MAPDSAQAMLSDHDLDVIFRAARTHFHWQDKAVPDVLLQAAYDLARMGPTSANCQPMRVVFIRSAEGKEKLRPCLAPGNVEKTMAAPVTALIGHDLAFYEHLPTQFPHTDAKSWFVGNEALIQETAFRNGSLQGAYLLIALRSLGLDCGPMSGFDKAKADAAFFAGTAVKSNFLMNIGHGVPEKLFPRSPRLAFDVACQLA